MIRQVSTQCIPVAVNLYKIRRAQDEGGELFRSVQRQKDQYQGIWIVSPDGQVLAGHHDIQDHKTWSQEVLATLSSGLETFGPVVPRKVVAIEDPLPCRGHGLAADGSMMLAVYTRYMHGERKDGPAVIDSVSLAAKEWTALLPSDIAPGTEWTLPEPVVRKFSRVLSPSSDQSTMPKPDEVTEVRFTGTVIEVQDGMAKLAYRGKIAAEHDYENKVSKALADLVGIGSYDVQNQQLRSVIWVFEGVYRGAPPWDAPRQMGAVVEWNSHDKVP